MFKSVVNGLGRGDFVDLAGLHEGVHFAIAIFGKAVDVVGLEEEGAVGGDFLGGVIVAEAPEGAEVVIAIDIDAFEGGGLFAVVDVAADDAEADAVVGVHGLGLEVGFVRVFDDGFDVFGAFGAGLEVVGAFADVPAVVAAFGDQVDFFPEVLPDITAPEGAGLGIKAVPPGIAEAIGEDFAAGAAGAHVGFGDERVVSGDGVGEFVLAFAVTGGGAGIDVEAEDFAEQGGGILAATEGIIGEAAIAEAEVEVAIGAEGELAAFVIAKGLGDLEEDAFAGKVGLVGIGGGDFKFADDGADGEVERPGILKPRIFLVVIDVK